MKQTAAKFGILVSFICLSFTCKAQWQAGLGIGRVMPHSGYKGVVKGGRYITLEAERYLKNSSWSMQFGLDWAKLHEDKNKGDVFRQPRLDLLSISAGVVYRFESINFIEPYAGAALGVTLYNFHHEPTNSTSQTTTNASFSILPLIGVQYKVTTSLVPFFQLKSVLVMDGPPQGFPKSSNATGYTAPSFGVRYTFL